MIGSRLLVACAWMGLFSLAWLGAALADGGPTVPENVVEVLDAGALVVPVAGAPDGDPVAIGREVIEAFRGHQWALGIAGLVMLLTWILRRAVPRLDARAVPLVTLILASAPTLVVALRQPGVTWWDIVGTTLVIWFSASGQWEVAVKSVRALIPWDRVLRRPAAASGISPTDPG